jgi:methylamine dehydrogenase light chain
MKSRFDRWFSARSVSIAERTSRRAFLGRLGVALVGSMAVPLLPVARNGQARAEGAAPEDANKGLGDYNNEKSCDYWAYCSIDAWMCHCCGGSASSCPPGSQMSPITWVGTCKNPNDDKSYVVSYNDCCGRSTCGRCFCNRNEGDTERYLPQRNNLITWCFGVAPTYHCTVARVMSQA